MQVLVATRNRGKQAEFRAMLASTPFTIVFPDDIGLAESPDEDVLEVHDTFEANARAKAHWFASRSTIATLADDSGLEVDALGGAPGVLSKRFSADDRLPASDHEVAAANNRKLLHLLADIPLEKRTARFRCALVLAGPDGSEIVAIGSAEGHIVAAPRGANGFGYDPVFFSDELGMTFGEAGSDAKDRVSHRARALEALMGMLV